MFFSNKKKYFLKILIIIIFSITGSRADTLHLKDSTLLAGKVKIKTSKSVTFKNSNGTFKIKRKYIKKIYITNEYEKDIAIQKKLGKEVDEEEIKRNFLAGAGKLAENKVEAEPKNEAKNKDAKTSSGWNNGRFTLSAARLQIRGEMKETIPFGYCGFAAYEHGAGSRYYLLPGLRLEGGYIQFENAKKFMKGPVWSAGLTWMLPFFNKTYGSIILTGTAGLSYLEFENGPLIKKTRTFTAWGSAGYEFPFSTVILQLQARYMIMFDKEVRIEGIGGLFGAGFKLF